MALVQKEFEKGPAGAEYAIGDDGGVLRTVAGNGTIAYTADAAAHGLYGLRFTAAGTASDLIRYAPPSSMVLSVSVVFRASALGTQVISLATAADAAILKIEYRSTTGYIAITDAAGAVFPMSNAVADSGLNTKFRVALNITINPTTATAGTINARRYDAAGNQVGLAVASTAANLGTAPVTKLNAGCVNVGTAGRTVDIDDLQWDDGTAVFLPAMSEPAPPVEPPASTRPVVGVLGDSKAHQGGTGVTTIPAAFANHGWTASQITVSGVSSRVPWGGTITPTTETSWNAWQSGGFNPQHVVLILGGNIRTNSQATWQSQFNSLFALVDNGARQIFCVNLAYQDPNDGAAFNAWYEGFVAGKAKARMIDQYSFMRAREATGQPISWNADGVHMEGGSTGYGLLNELIASNVATFLDEPTPSAPTISTVAARTVGPGSTVSTTVTATNNPTSYTWRQISGPAVNLTGSGATRIFAAPDQTTASTVVLGVVATNAGGSSAERTLTVNVTARIASNIYKTITFDEIPNGTALTLANSGLALQGATGGNSGTASTLAKVRGVHGGRFNRPAGGNVAGVFGRHTPDSPHGPFQLEVEWIGESAPTAPRGLIQLSGTVGASAGARLLQVLHSAGSGVYMIDRNNASPGNLIEPAAVVSGKAYRLTFWGDTTTGEYHARAYDFTTGDLVGSRNVTGAALGSVPITQMDFGTYNNVDGATMFDTIRIGDRMIEPPAYVFIEAAPTVNDLAAITTDSLKVVTVAASAVGGVTSWAWRQVSGPGVTLSGTDSASVAFVAPATQDGATIVLGVRATNATGTSPEKTVTIAVAAHVWWKLVAGGSLRPVSFVNSWT
jgi:hypothetical protein